MPNSREVNRDGAGPCRRSPADPKVAVCLSSINDSVQSNADMSADEGASGSKSSNNADSAHINFKFLNFSHPGDGKKPENRQTVRSHVTGVQHQKTRDAAAEQLRKSQQLYPGSFQDGQRRGSYFGSATETSSPEAASPTSPTTPATLVRLNPAEIYYEEWQPWLRPVLEHYMHYMAIDLPETDATSRELIRSTLLTITLTDRASLHALLLVAGAHWNKVRPTQPHTINLLQLRGMAIQEINQALSAVGRATSDQLIIAVGKMATFELLFGARDTFHTHMTGLQRMISLRGGLQALGQHGLLERTLLWIDANAEEIMNSNAHYFPSAVFSSTVGGHPRPNRQLFAVGLQGQAS